MRTISLARLVGAEVRRQRQERKLTQTQLGERVHIRHTEISKLETGRRAPRLDTLAVVVEQGLEMSLSAFWVAVDTRRVS